MSHRHYLVAHDTLEQSVEFCQSLVWPMKTRYVAWAYHATNRMFRAYVEFIEPHRPKALSGIPSERVTCCTSMSREEQRDQVLNLEVEGASVWQWGDWAAGNRGRKSLPTETPPATDAPMSANMQEQLDALRVRMQEENDALRQQIAELQARPVGQTINAGTVNLIVINNFGQEDKSYIPIETLHNRRRWSGIVDTIRDIHWHPDHPENHNVRMVSRRRKTAAIRRNGAWHREHANEVVKKLMWNGYDTVIRSLPTDHPETMTAEHVNAVLIGGVLKSRKPDAVEARQRVLTMVLETPKLPDGVNA